MPVLPMPVLLPSPEDAAARGVKESTTHDDDGENVSSLVPLLHESGELSSSQQGMMEEALVGDELSEPLRQRKQEQQVISGDEEEDESGHESSRHSPQSLAHRSRLCLSATVTLAAAAAFCLLFVMLAAPIVVLAHQRVIVAFLPSPPRPPEPPAPPPPPSQPPVPCDGYRDGNGCWVLSDTGEACTQACDLGVGLDIMRTLSEGGSPRVRTALSRRYDLTPSAQSLAPPLPPPPLSQHPIIPSLLPSALPLATLYEPREKTWVRAERADAPVRVPGSYRAVCFCATPTPSTRPFSWLPSESLPPMPFSPLAELLPRATTLLSALLFGLLAGAAVLAAGRIASVCQACIETALPLIPVWRLMSIVARQCILRPIILLPLLAYSLLVGLTEYAAFSWRRLAKCSRHALMISRVLGALAELSIVLGHTFSRALPWQLKLSAAKIRWRFRSTDGAPLRADTRGQSHTTLTSLAGLSDEIASRIFGQEQEGGFGDAPSTMRHPRRPVLVLARVSMRVLLTCIIPILNVAVDLLVLRLFALGSDWRLLWIGSVLLAAGCILNALGAAGALPPVAGPRKLSGLNLFGTRVHSKSHAAAPATSVMDELAEQDAAGGHDACVSESELAEDQIQDPLIETSSDGGGEDRLPSWAHAVLGLCALSVPLQALRDICDGVVDHQSINLINLRATAAVAISAPQLFVQTVAIGRAGLRVSLLSQPLVVAAAALSLFTASTGLSAAWTERSIEPERRVFGRLFADSSTVTTLRFGCVGFCASDLLMRATSFNIICLAGSPYLLAVFVPLIFTLAHVAARVLSGERALPGSGSGSGSRDARAHQPVRGHFARGRARMAELALRGRHGHHSPTSHTFGEYALTAAFQVIAPHAGHALSSAFLVTDALLSTVVYVTVPVACILAGNLVSSYRADGAHGLGSGRLARALQTDDEEDGLAARGSESMKEGLESLVPLEEAVATLAQRSVTWLVAQLSVAATAVLDALTTPLPTELVDALLFILLCAAACKLGLFFGCVWAARVGRRGCIGCVGCIGTDDKEASSDPLDGRTPLMQAAHYGCVWTAESFVKQGASAHETDAQGRTALHLASANGHRSTIEMLLGRDASIVQSDAYGRSALCYACLHGQLAAAELLLDRGAALEHKGNDLATPLLLASARGHAGVVKMLIERRSCLEHADRDGGGALASACANGKLSVVSLLLEHFAEYEQTDVEGRTPLIWACASGHASSAAMLIERDAYLEAETKAGHTALCRAAANGHEDATILLLHHGAAMEHESRSGATPLMHACLAEQLSIIRLLLHERANIDHSGSSGQSALLLASAAGHREIVLELLAQGADVEQIDADGDSALCEAAAHGHVEVAGALLASGADANHSNRHQRTPLHLASAQGWEALVALLLSYGAQVDLVSADGRSALCWACTTGNASIVHRLLEASASITLADNEGDTPLALAQRRGFVTIAELLHAQSKEWWRELYVELMMLKEYPPWDLTIEREDEDNDVERASRA